MTDRGGDAIEARDEEVETLARALRLDEASDLACRRGLALRAFELALEARDHLRAEAAARVLGAMVDPLQKKALGNRARAAAVRRGDATAEGIVAQVLGELDDAAMLYERGSAWVRAAAIHRMRGDLAREGRALERQCKSDPTDEPSRIALARVLVAAGRFEPALRALTGVGDAPEVVALRARAHAAMGLDDGGRASTNANTNDSTGANTDTNAAGAPEGQVANDPRAASLLFGRYQVVREVASTASSRVLEAIDRLTPDRPRVALKIFTGGAQVGAGRDALVRFQREMDILTHLDAPGLLRARQVLLEGPTIVLPWMAGGSLEALVAAGPIAPRRAVAILTRVLEALEAAHRRGIVHRDIKPANVLLDEAGGAFLADFGVAHLGDASATATAGLLGTLRYMSPEQRLGEPATPKSDVFAIGLIALEVLGLPKPPDALPATLTRDVAVLLGDLLADAPEKRPEAATARKRFLAIAWPDRIDQAPHPRSAAPSSTRTYALVEGRFADRVGRIRHDRVLDRREILIGKNDPRVKLARALAQIDHPALPIVCGLDATTGALRVEAIEGSQVSIDTLTPIERQGIEEALAALLAKGVTRQAISGLRRTPRGVVIALPHDGEDEYQPRE